MWILLGLRVFGCLPVGSLQPLPRRREFGLQLLRRRQGELVFAGHDFVRQRVEGVVGEGGVGGGAEDDADGRVFAFVGPVLSGVVAVEQHLAGIGVGVGSELEIDDHEAAQSPVEEE